MHNICIKIKLLFAVILIAFSTSGQKYFFDNYKTTDGIESSKIYSICQTNDGFVWLGTDIGLTRFDGSHFDNFTVNDGIGNGGVRVLFEDKFNQLWIGHDEGGGVTRYSENGFESIDSLKITSNITSIIQDTEGTVWITTFNDGAFKILNPDSKPQQIKYEQFTGKQLSDRIFNSNISSAGILYMVTDIGIQQFDSDQNSFVRYAPENLDMYFQFSVMFEDSQKNIWYGTYNGGLYKQENSTKKTIYFDIKDGLASNWITDILEDKKGNIWIAHWDLGTRGGLTRISPNGSMMVFDQHNGLQGNKIWCIVEDKEENILIGTTDQGLSIFKDEKFISYSEDNGLVNNQVYAIYQDENNNFWFGTNEGISVLNYNDKTFDNFTQQSHQISDQIRFLIPDKNNNIWIGTDDQGVQQYDIHKNRFISKPEVNTWLPKLYKTVNAMEIDQDNCLWIGTIDGLIQYAISGNQYIKTYLQKDGLTSNEIKAIYCDSKGRLWVGTKGGISYSKDNQFIPLNTEENMTPTCITENSKGYIIIGTTAGVYVIDNYKLLIKYDINNGLLTNNINSLTVDDFDNIYIGTTIGLNKIVDSENAVISYSARDGFTGIETEPHASYKDKNGKIWIGTANGVTCYNPIIDNNIPDLPKAWITGIQVNGEQIEITPNAEFPHTKNNFLFQYNCISITHPTSVKYRFMLEGNDDNWVEANDDKSVRYTLLPGKYQFKVMAINSYGYSLNDPATYRFVILAPFYKRPFFIIIAIIIVILAILILMMVRERNLKREKKILADKVKERTRELSDAYSQLSERNKDITDSIQYASRIQFAILPIDIPYNDTFIFFKPKDIVSGDFYWANIHNGKEYLAAVDCTGHGVPGAFMSVIGHTSLNKIIIEQGISKPSDILIHLNTEVSNNLHQKEDDAVNDGMDLALISYDVKTRTLEYAGAYNPLWIVRNGELVEVKADRFSIGRSYHTEKIFTNHQIRIEKGDMVYMFSDGFVDQFGGPDGKKFKSAQLKQLLIDNSHLSVEKQNEILNDTLMSWKGDLEQIDDILIVGRRFD